MDIENIEFLIAYKKAKEHYKLIAKSVTREEFINHSGISKKTIDKAYGSYTRFAITGEDYFRASLPSSQRALVSEQFKKFDDDATIDDCIEDLRKLKRENPLLAISRNFYREHGAYSDSTWNRYFGTFLEFRRQAGLELTRQQHELEKHIAKHASVDHYSEYYEREVAPFYQKYEHEHLPSKLKRLMGISDIHDIECAEFTLEVFIAECKRKQPDIIFLNGDIYDLYEFSKYTQDPRNVKIKERFEFVRNRIFKPLREVCPNAQIDFFMGNHEFRLVKHLADATPNLRILLSDVMNISFATVFGLDEFQINWVSKFDLSAFNKNDINNILKQNYKIYFDAYAVTHEPDETLMKSYSGTNGHHHSVRQESGYNIHVGCTTWIQTAAAHERDAEYLTRVSKWNKGFIEVVIHIEKRQVVQRSHQTHDDWTEIDGVYYERKEK